MKNMILKTITAIMAIIWIISACALDSTGIAGKVTVAVFIATSAYLGIFLYANKDHLL